MPVFVPKAALTPEELITQEMIGYIGDGITLGAFALGVVYARRAYRDRSLSPLLPAVCSLVVAERSHRYARLIHEDTALQMDLMTTDEVAAFDAIT